MKYWDKLGVVYTPSGSLDWAKTHAMVPTPFQLNNDVVRVFITCCDSEGIGRPSFVDVSAYNPSEVLYVHDKPILEIGQPGTFDENGLICCSVTRDLSGHLMMYYAGFELGSKVRYRLLSGLAISQNNGLTFERIQKTPALERSSKELYFRGGPFCVNEDGLFKMWYVAGSTWELIGNKAMPVYDIRYVESKDGLHWPPEGTVQLPVSLDDEHGFGRPYIIGNSDKGYELFYSIRKRSIGKYRLGYATSHDCKNWVRKDRELNLDVSISGFDDDAIMYAAPIDLNGRRYIFYNGNEFGKFGFAVAAEVRS